MIRKACKRGWKYRAPTLDLNFQHSGWWADWDMLQTHKAYKWLIRATISFCSLDQHIICLMFWARSMWQPELHRELENMNCPMMPTYSWWLSHSLFSFISSFCMKSWFIYFFCLDWMTSQFRRHLHLFLFFQLLSWTFNPAFVRNDNMEMRTKHKIGFCCRCRK